MFSAPCLGPTAITIYIQFFFPLLNFSSSGCNPAVPFHRASQVIAACTTPSSAYSALTQGALSCTASPPCPKPEAKRSLFAFGILCLCFSQ